VGAVTSVYVIMRDMHVRLPRDCDPAGWDMFTSLPGSMMWLSGQTQRLTAGEALYDLG